MFYEDEKEYIMRIIKEMFRVLFSLMLGKKYVQVELPLENKYDVAGGKLDEFKRMVDMGQINEAENIILDRMNNFCEDDLMVALFFYQYVGEKGEEFLQAHNYSLEEVAEGLKMLAEKSGYGEFVSDYEL